MGDYKGLETYLKLIKDEWGISLCFNDYCGLLAMDPNLATVLQPYLIHNNPFCMAIKSKEKLWHKCLSMKKFVIQKSLEKQDIYCGSCYCGITEFVVPIMSQGNLLGVIFAGQYSNSSPKTRKKLKTIGTKNNLDVNELFTLYEQSTRSNPYSTGDIRARLQLVADFLINTYNTLKPKHGDYTKQAIEHLTTEQYILNHALEYIKQNYATKITLKTMTTFCHCSSSHFSHLFKKNMGMTLPAYITSIRMDKAKYLLTHTSLSISAIANTIGYDDPNYFSQVFKNKEGLSPSLYKETHKV